MTTPILLPLLALGCTSENELVPQKDFYGAAKLTELENETVTDRYIQSDEVKTDVLFVVDDSCSMGTDQAKLTSNFPAFFEHFTLPGIDYHIGVTTTDMYSTTKQGRLQPAYGFYHMDRYTQDTIDASSMTDANGDPLVVSEVFNQMASVGTWGAGSEKGSDATHHAINDYTGPAEPNEDFIRPDANLDVVMVSDEGDWSTTVTPTDLITELNDRKVEKQYFIDNGIYPSPADISALTLVELDNLRTRSGDLVKFHSIVGLSGDNCASGGADYLSITDQVGGESWSICDNDWAPMLSQLGLAASGLTREFFLSQVPVPGTIEVKVMFINDQGSEETLFPQEGVDWEYRRSRNSVYFLDPAAIPQPDARVEITFNPLSSFVEYEAEDTADTGF